MRRACHNGSSSDEHVTCIDVRGVGNPQVCSESVLDGVAQRNHAMVKEQLLPGGMATLIREDKPLQLHFDAFVERLPTTGVTKLEERLYDPLVRIDDDIAVVWVPYKFFIDDKVDHCGTDVFSLIHQDGRWLVSGIADNSRKDCLSK